MTKWGSRLRREMNRCDIVGPCKPSLAEMNDDEVLAQIKSGIHTDCVLNYETVKYFGGEQHEGERYREVTLEYQAMEYKFHGLCSHCIHFLLLLKVPFSFYESDEYNSKTYRRE